MYEDKRNCHGNQKTVYLDRPSLLKHVDNIECETDGEAGRNIVEELFYYGQASGANLWSWVNYLGIGGIEKFDNFGF